MTLELDPTGTGIRLGQFNPNPVPVVPAMGVQIIYDSWRNADRIIRFKGRCLYCLRRTWACDDGENDPRGILGDYAAYPLRAEDYGMVGPDVPQCFMCGNEEHSYKHSLKLAKSMYWKQPADA